MSVMQQLQPTVIQLTDEDKNNLRKLGINVTMDPGSTSTISLYRKNQDNKNNPLPRDCFYNAKKRTYLTASHNWRMGFL